MHGGFLGAYVLNSMREHCGGTRHLTKGMFHYASSVRIPMRQNYEGSAEAKRSETTL